MVHSFAKCPYNELLCATLLLILGKAANRCVQWLHCVAKQCLNVCSKLLCVAKQCIVVSSRIFCVAKQCIVVCSRLLCVAAVYRCVQ